MSTATSEISFVDDFPMCPPPFGGGEYVKADEAPPLGGDFARVTQPVSAHDGSARLAREARDERSQSAFHWFAARAPSVQTPLTEVLPEGAWI